MTNEPPDRIPTEGAVFTKTIDNLISRIWELGGKAELLANIERLKRLPSKEFEAELTTIYERLSANLSK
jgi:hypothetical protein